MRLPPPAPCFHGGKSILAAGPQLRRDPARDVISADVLDAWFPPAPGVLRALAGGLPWLVKTSPPADCAPFVQAVAAARGLEPAHLVPGAGSSDLIFRAFLRWLSPPSRVLILDPMYGEYAHVLERVLGCAVDRLTLDPGAGYRLSVPALREALARRYDLVVLVNPNSPTGVHLPRTDLQAALANLPRTTRIWIDETYVDYTGAGQSLESFAAGSSSVFVCKSMSKVYALSGLRLAYLCGPADEVAALRAITPPWVVGLPAQVAGIEALLDPAYYAERYAETHELRRALAERLVELGWRITSGCANFLLGHLPEEISDLSAFVARGEARGLFLRQAAAMGSGLKANAVRMAVKDADTNQRMVEILRAVR